MKLQAGPSGLQDLILKTWLALAGVMCVFELPLIFQGKINDLDTLFLSKQDLPVLACILVPVVALRIAPKLGSLIEGWVRIPDGGPGILRALGGIPLRACLGLCAAGCILASWLGHYWVVEAFPLSMDEFMALFGAQIFAHGQIAAAVAPQWREFADALAPKFLLRASDGSWWTSAYLPVNSAFLALGRLANIESLVEPLLAGVSVIAIHGVGRKLWPGRTEVAWVAAAFLVTSSQFLVTAMTPYAMTAHLALNLVWLWLFLRGDRLGHLAAAGVGFLATGLHEVVFHPLFVAPFIFQLASQRRWAASLFYCVAYLLIVLFWLAAYPHWVIPPVAAAVGAGGHPRPPLDLANVIEAYALIALNTLRAFRIGNIVHLGYDLIRFITWQNPLLPPLLCIGVVSFFRAGGAMRSLAAGLLLFVAAFLVLAPEEGHAWGYRYGHGWLGSACLIAARTWVDLTAQLRGEARKVADRSFGLIAVLALVVLLPIRALQVRQFAHPYVAAEAAVRRANTDMVMIDDDRVLFGVDLTRNDPYLQDRPLELYLPALDMRQVRRVCRMGSISVFSRHDALAYGILTFETPPDPASERRLGVLKRLSCGLQKRPVTDVAGHPL